MVKATLISGTSARRHWRTIAEDCVRQLCDTTVIDWLSNGEDAVHGRLWKAQRCSKGLRIGLESGHHVTWKLGSKSVNLIMETIACKFSWCSLSGADVDAVGVIPRELTLN